MALRIQQAPPDSGEIVLGRTLPSLLDEAVARNPNPRAFNQRTPDGGWQPLGTEAFRTRAERMALGLRDAGLVRGDRVAFFTESDLSFCLADMACLIAGLVGVPIYLTHTPGAMRHILEESGARMLIVTSPELFRDIQGVLKDAPAVERVVFWDVPPGETHEVEVPAHAEVTSYEALEARGAELLEREPGRADALKADVSPHDLATIIYTSGTTGMPKGVMLSHENISSNVMAAMTGLTTFRRGPEETVISFLPLTHIFARTLHYGVMWLGSSVHFSHPDLLREDFQTVNPTFFAAVPRVLERAFERIQAAGASLHGVKRQLFDWSMGLARRYRVDDPPKGFDAVQLKLADRLVFSKWRDALGGRIRTIIVGGAALRPELVNALGAAGIDVLQGYGLTETSPVIAFNRPDRNRPGSVGPVLVGTEVAIGDDGEILARGPHIMKGYYRQPDKTASVIDADGWFHTGDLGALDDDGFLRITGRKKNLFKLSTGLYVMPQAVEDRLEGEALVDTALVVGESEKFCAALVFVNAEALGIHDPEALHDPEVQERFRQLLARANERLGGWEKVKRAALILAELTPANGMLTPKLSVKREKVLDAFRDYVEVLYGHADKPLERGVVIQVEAAARGRSATAEGAEGAAAGAA